VRTREEEVAARGAVLVFLGTGTPAQAESFAREHAGRHPVRTDPTRRVFALAGMRRGIGVTLHPRMLRNLLRALRAGFRQTKVQGVAWQQGGVVVLDAQGAVVHRQVDRAGGEPVDLDAALAKLG
jgi:hypothetical protein